MVKMLLSLNRQFESEVVKESKNHLTENDGNKN